MHRTLNYTCTSSDHLLRADVVLARVMDVSRSRIQSWIKGGHVTKSGEIITSKTMIREGDSIIIQPPNTLPDRLEPEQMPLEVLFEDSHFLVINKPAGLVVHAGAGHSRGTLTAGLLHHCGKSLSGIGGVERPGIVHRLDKDTSGVLAVAKHDQAHEALSQQFRQRQTIKIYLALLLGKPKWNQGVWDQPIGRHPVDRKKMSIMKGRGREARSDFQIVCISAPFCLAKILIHTGRTHQIRVHASHAGIPVAGDSLYGNQHPALAKLGIQRQMLHAWSLTLDHPITRKSMTFVAPPPPDLAGILDQLFGENWRTLLNGKQRTTE